MSDSQNFSSVVEYVDSICSGKHFETEEAKQAFKQRLLDTFKEYKLYSTGRVNHGTTRSYHRDVETIRKDWDTYEKLKAGEKKSYSELHDLLEQLIDYAHLPELNWSDKREKYIQREIIRMIVIDDYSREPLVSFSDCLKVDVDVQKAIEQTKAAAQKDQKDKQEKQGQEQAD